MNSEKERHGKYRQIFNNFTKLPPACLELPLARPASNDYFADELREYLLSKIKGIKHAPTNKAKYPHELLQQELLNLLQLPIGWSRLKMKNVSDYRVKAYIGERLKIKSFLKSRASGIEDTLHIGIGVIEAMRANIFEFIAL